MCELVELEPSTFLDRYPSELSGGECRRVSLAMAISASPELLLIDEATGNLDWLTRRNMQQMLQKLCAEHKLTTLAVTHDVEEAVWLSDRVIVMRNGRRTGEFTINLPRPRNEATRTNPLFTERVAQVRTCPGKINRGNGVMANLAFNSVEGGAHLSHLGTAGCIFSFPITRPLTFWNAATSIGEFLHDLVITLGTT